MHGAQPWLAWYRDVPTTLDYPRISLYEAVMRTVRRIPDAPAVDFLGAGATYRELGDAIDRCANALAALGVAPGDRITISLPTSPQAISAVYGSVKLGAVPAMIHPLSMPGEIERYLNLSGSRFAVTLDAFYQRFAEVLARTRLETLILTRISDCLPAARRALFWVARGRRTPPVARDAPVRWWSQLMRAGVPKAILLSHHNLISEGMQVAAWVGLGPADVVLVALPIFHGFCLGALVNAPLMSGAGLVLMPQFDAKAVARLMRTKRPTLLVGVPTMFRALVDEPAMHRADLSSLRAAFSGGDVLHPTLKERFERMVAARGGQAKLLEGYGLTESVTAIMLQPLHEARAGTIGVPFPDTLATICRPGTVEELEPGQVGEICVSGPAVMLGYLDDPDATASALRVHADGRVWLHTGDLGSMDGDGFFSFTSRLKRMIKSSGFNVYPDQVEAVLAEHPAVAEACVVGIPDEVQGERVKAFVVPAAAAREGPELAEELIAHCRAQLIKWSCPREVEFRRELPKTRLGKIDYAALTREAAETHARSPSSSPNRA